jgi:hypothetical protein
MAPEVKAALIGGAVAGIGVMINNWVVLRNDRKRREGEARMERGRRDAELLVTALQYFKESQRRSVGIAALAVLRQRSNEAWTESQGAVRDLYYRQLLYLFAHGKNRWQAHEISNMEAMTESLLTDDSPLQRPMSDRLLSAMTRYKTTWDPKKAPREADVDAVEYLLERIEKWQTKLNGGEGGTERGLGSASRRRDQRSPNTEDDGPRG